MDKRTSKALFERHVRHLEDGNHGYRPPQEDAAWEVAIPLEEGGPGGSFIRPTGTGKTYMIGQHVVHSNTKTNGDRDWKYPVAIVVPTTQLRDQTELKLKAYFDFSDDEIGVHRAEETAAKQKAALEKPVLIITDISYMNLVAKGIMEPRLLNYLDEFDLWRGARHREFATEQLVDQGKYILGPTATPWLRDGSHINDWIFEPGTPPLHETTFRQAVRDREISEMSNIVAEVEVSRTPDFDIKGKREFTEKERDQLARNGGWADHAVDMHLRGTHPQTGVPLRDYPSIFFTPTIALAEYIAERMERQIQDLGLAQKIGVLRRGDEDSLAEYAVAVSGRTPKIFRPDEISLGEILAGFVDVKHPTQVLAGSRIIGRGTDVPPAVVGYDLNSFKNERSVVQNAGRIARLAEDKPTGLYVQLTDQHTIGRIALFADAVDYNYAPPPEPTYKDETTEAAEPNQDPFPEITGIRIHAGNAQIREILGRQERIRWKENLPVKGTGKLNAEQMARRLGVKTEAVAPLYEAFQMAYDNTPDTVRYVQVAQEDVPAQKQSNVHYRGQRLAVDNMGYYHNSRKGDAEFCIDESCAGVLATIIFGRPKSRPDHVLDWDQARRLLGIRGNTPRAKRFDTLRRELEETVVNRANPNQQIFRLQNEDGQEVKFHRNGGLGFYRSSQQPGFTSLSKTEAKAASKSPRHLAFPPEILLPIIMMVDNVPLDRAITRFETAIERSNIKTAAWNTREEVIEKAGITTAEMDAFNAEWKALKPRRRGFIVAGYKVAVGEKQLPNGEREKVLHDCEIEWMKHRLGLENDFDPKASKNIGRSGSRGR